MKCPECNKDVGDLAKLENKNMESGQGYNHEFGQTEHLFSADFKCPECGKWFYHGDSSL